MFYQCKITTRLASLAEKGMLIIGEHYSFITQGGACNFFFENNKLHFEIKLSKPSKAGIKFNSKLLYWAHLYDN